MTAHESEKEDNIRLRKAAEFITHCREDENRLRVELTQAIERSKRAKEKHETLFAECEKRAVERRKAGLIQATID